MNSIERGHGQAYKVREQDLLISRGIWLIEEEPTRRARDTIQALKQRITAVFDSFLCPIIMIFS